EEYKDEEKPFFLYVAYNAPHDPLMAWPEDIARHRGKYLAGWQATRQSRFNRQIEMGLFPADLQLSDPEFGDWDSLGEAQKQQEDLRMAVYAAMVDRLDQNIGKLIDKLTELGELDNTLILFASDNGGSAEVVRIGEGEIGSATRWSSVKKDWANVSNTPFRKYKNFSHEGGICTPFIACWPEMIKKQGSIVRQPLHFIDIMATFVEIANAPYPQEWKGETVVPLQGTSFLPLLTGADMLQRPDPLFWQWSRGRAIRDGQWKAVSHSDQWQLYDINDDRTELNDLAGTYPERTATMAARWQAWFDGTKKKKDP
ncbi:MAG: sulfatase-like hydrolase/transferase, partial [Pirellulaceae bacterium]